MSARKIKFDEPNIKGLTISKDGRYAEFNLDVATRGDFWIAMQWLKENEFEYDMRSYNLGYYDSVEDITLEFTRKTKQQTNGRNRTNP